MYPCTPALFSGAMRPSRLGLIFLATLLLVTPSSGKAGDAAPPPLVAAPRDSRFQFAYETAFNFGVNNPNNYITNPHFLSLRWQPRATEHFFHTPILFTQQFEVSAAAVPFWQGPEHHYFGLGVGTRLIYSLEGSRWAVFVGGRCYVGAIDSSGPPYGQGEDLTFSPTVSGGILYRATDRQHIGISLLYQHFSNAGLSEPEAKNVGLNTLGPMLEWNVSF